MKNFKTNSGMFTLIYRGKGETFLHSPTHQRFPAGTILRNPAGWFGVLEDDGNWSWYEQRLKRGRK